MKYHFLFCASLLSVSCVMTPLIHEQEKIPHDFAGMAHAGNPVNAAENALLNELGIVWIRNDFYWDDIEPRRDEWNFSRFDKMVDDNKKAGRKIIALLLYDTPWIHKDNKTKKYIPPDKLHYYLNYVEKIVQRYKGKVDAWEIWNEPNMPVFWRGPQKHYLELSKAAVKKIKEVDPKAFIVAGVFWRSPASLIRKMAEYGAFENVDALSVHPYAINPEGALAVYEQFEALIRKLGFRGAIWVTEIGYPVAGFYPSRVREDKQGAYIIKTMTMLAAHGAHVIIWYQLTDDYRKADAPRSLDSEHFFGLTYSDYEKRAGAESFALIAHALAGSVWTASWQGKDALPKGAHAYCFTKPDGSRFLVYWDKKNPPELRPLE